MADDDTRYEHRPDPVQYTEPLPDWVREELACHRDKLPALRAGICAAIANSKGILKQGETNKQQNYKYTGYDSILEAVRTPMAEAGITIDQVSCDLEAEISYSSRESGPSGTTIWKWRAVYLVTHIEGASVVRIVRTFTSPGNKSAGIASSSCDRILLTRLMRIAGGKDEPGQEDTRGPTYGRQERPGAGARRPDERAPRASTPAATTASSAPPAGAGAAPATETRPKTKQHREFTVEQRQVATEFVDLVIKTLSLTVVRSRLVSWGRILRGTAPTLPKAELDRAWEAFELCCNNLSLVPAVISAEVKAMDPIPWSDVHWEPETGEMYVGSDGTLL